MQDIFDRMKANGFASSNIVFGIGGLLLQNFNRDDQGFALKATHVVVNGQGRDIMKDPITDQGKKSHTGYIALRKDVKGNYITVDGLTEEQAKDTLLQTVFKDGKIVKEYTLSQVRKNVLK
jgi:nicotinamide phosphoribosyltransferase